MILWDKLLFMYQLKAWFYKTAEMQFHRRVHSFRKWQKNYHHKVKTFLKNDIQFEWMAEKFVKFSSFSREIDIFSHYRNHTCGIAFNLDTLVTDNWHIIKILSRATINYCSLSPSIIYCNFWNNSYFFCLKMERDQTNWC